MSCFASTSRKVNIMLSSRHFAVPLVLFTLVSLLLPGCGGKGSSGESLLADANQTSLDRICTLYFQYQLTHNGHGPPDEAAFRSFIQSRPEQQLKRIGVDPGNIDALFVSERDNEQFVVLWDVVAGERDEPTPIVAEKNGVDGIRFVGCHRKPHREVNDAEFKKLFRN